MVKNCDHVTIVVRDVTAAKEFFNLLGFKEDKSVVISGEKFEKYMGVDGIEAQHVTMELAGASPRMEVQLLKYDHPDPIEDPNITNLTKLGYNHVCFAVDDIEAEVEKLKAAGVEMGVAALTAVLEAPVPEAAAARPGDSARRQLALRGLGQLAGELGKITDSLSTNSHFCLSVISFMEALVLGYARSDLALGEFGRRWLDEDEFLVRRRIHRDVRSAMGEVEQ